MFGVLLGGGFANSLFLIVGTGVFAYIAYDNVRTRRIQLHFRRGDVRRREITLRRQPVSFSLIVALEVGLAAVLACLLFGVNPLSTFG